MIRSTHHFATTKLATSYYQRQDDSHTIKDTIDKIKAGEIAIGRPVMDRTFHQFLNADGRWCYIEYENGKAKK